MRRFLLPLAVMTLLAACASPPAQVEPTPDPKPTLAACPDTIIIEDFFFNPSECQVAPGTTITFLNKDAMTHTATATSSAQAAFDTGSLGQNESAKITFTEPGEYPYYCTLHPDVQASITVE